MKKVTLKPKVYSNIVELARENGLKEVFDSETGGLENYLADYSDRPIVYLFLCDMIGSNIIEDANWSCSVTETDWRKVPISVR